MYVKYVHIIMEVHVYICRVGGAIMRHDDNFCHEFLIQAHFEFKSLHIVNQYLVFQTAQKFNSESEHT